MHAFTCRPPAPARAGAADNTGRQHCRETVGGCQRPAGAATRQLPTANCQPRQLLLQEFVAKWQDRDEGENFHQKYDAELVKDELRPIVFEEIRLQVGLLSVRAGGRGADAGAGAGAGVGAWSGLAWG